MAGRYLRLFMLLSVLPGAAAAPKSRAKKEPAGTTSAAVVVASTTVVAEATAVETTPSAATATTPDAKAAAKIPAEGRGATTTAADATTATEDAGSGATTTGAIGAMTSTGTATGAEKEAVNQEIIGEADLASQLASGKAGAAASTTEQPAAEAAGATTPAAAAAALGAAGPDGGSEGSGEENTTSEKNMTTKEFANQLGSSLEENRKSSEEMTAATWEDLGPGDMDQCFLAASIEYAPDMPGEEVTTEEGLLVCQERCKSTTGCVTFTYWQLPRGPGEDVGKCHLQGEDAVRKEKLLTEHCIAGPGVYPKYCAQARHLLAGMVTFGAPAISNPPMANPGGKCIEGLRIFTENTKLRPGNGYGQQEDAASMITRFPHARTPTFVLHDPTEDEKPSLFQNCPGKPSWPVFKGARYGEWGIHGIGDVYLKRIKEQTMPGVPDYISNLAKAVAGILNKFASFTYNGDIVTIREDVRSIPGWTLAGYAEVKGMGTDLDRVLVVQYDTLDCGVVFQGSQGFYDLMSFFIDYGTGFCGFRNTHVGVRNELWKVTSDPDYQALKPVLAQCRTTHCIGHSLGGALCELFTGCANTGRLNSSDYKQLAWLPGVPKKMEEVKVPGVDYEVPADFDEESLPYLSSDTRKENPQLSDWANKLPIGAAFEVPGEEVAPRSRTALSSRGISALVAGGLPLLLIVMAAASLGRANRARRHGEASEQVPFIAEEGLGVRP